MTISNILQTSFIQEILLFAASRKVRSYC